MPTNHNTMIFQDQINYRTSVPHPSVKRRFRAFRKKVLLINSSAQANLIHGYRIAIREVVDTAPTYKEAGDYFRIVAESKPEKKERKMSKLAKLSATIKDKLSQ